MSTSGTALRILGVGHLALKKAKCVLSSGSFQLMNSGGGEEKEGGFGYRARYLLEDMKWNYSERGSDYAAGGSTYRGPAGLWYVVFY